MKQNKTSSPLLMAVLNNENKKNRLTNRLKRCRMNILPTCKQGVMFQRVKKNLQKILLAFGLMAFLTEPAYAGISITSITNAAQALLDIMTGMVANILAGCAIAGMGYMWLSGRWDFTYAGKKALAIGVIMGAADIVDALL